MNSKPSTSSTSTSIPLPPSFKRLVARNVGGNFREVAHTVSLDSQRDLLSHRGPTDIVIAVKHAGINGGCETFRARGEYAFQGNRGQENFPLGAEGVGVIVSAGPR